MSNEYHLYVGMDTSGWHAHGVVAMATNEQLAWTPVTNLPDDRTTLPLVHWLINVLTIH